MITIWCRANRKGLARPWRCEHASGYVETEPGATTWSKERHIAGPWRPRGMWRRPWSADGVWTRLCVSSETACCSIKCAFGAPVCPRLRGGLPGAVGHVPSLQNHCPSVQRTCPLRGGHFAGQKCVPSAGPSVAPPADGTGVSRGRAGPCAFSRRRHGSGAHHCSRLSEWGARRGRWQGLLTRDVCAAGNPEPRKCRVCCFERFPSRSPIP